MVQENTQVLSDLQREQWAVDGYLQLEGVLSADEVKFFADQVDRVRTLPGYEPSRGQMPLGHYAWVEHADPDPEAFMDRRNLLPYHQAFIDLVDRPGLFDLVLDIMGPHIQFSMSQAIVRESGDRFPGYTHTDGGESQRQIRVTETSRPVAIKAMYLLSDVTEKDSGAFTVFPGSHMRPFPERGERTPHPHAPGAVQLMGKAGDCYLFPHALWHGPAPNRSGTARKTLLYNYCQMFVRWYDFAAPPQEVMDSCTPRQRRLLGDLGYDFRPGSFFYVPEDQEALMRNVAA